MLGILGDAVGNSSIVCAHLLIICLLLLILFNYSSVFMGSKVKEMDEVIKMIHLSTKQFQDNDQGRTLLVCATSSWLFAVSGF